MHATGSVQPEPTVPKWQTERWWCSRTFLSHRGGQDRGSLQQPPPIIGLDVGRVAPDLPSPGRNGWIRGQLAHSINSRGETVDTNLDPMGYQKEIVDQEQTEFFIWHNWADL